MPTNMNMWGQGWGVFNPFRSRAIPSSIYEKYYPKYQSPYAADPTSMESLGGLRSGTNEEWAKWNSIKAFYDNPMQSIMQGLGMNPSGGVGGGGGGGTQPDPYAGMTHLWRDPTGMIHDFGDNPQTTTPNGGGVDMNQMMNIFQMLNMMNGNRGNRGNRGNGNRGNDPYGRGAGTTPYGRGAPTPGGYNTKPLVTQPNPETPPPPPPPPPTYTAPPPGGGDPSYYYSQQ